jgi:hypothetical protein
LQVNSKTVPSNRYGGIPLRFFNAVRIVGRAWQRTRAGVHRDRPAEAMGRPTYMANSMSAVGGLVQMGKVEIHTWGSEAAAYSNPIPSLSTSTRTGGLAWESSWRLQESFDTS